MNNLEFIEKEIAMVKKKISMAKSKFTIKGITYYQLNEIKEEINILRDRLQVFHQIKSALEAWEVVQGTIVEGQDGDGRYCYIETVYFTGEKGEKVTKGLYNDETR